MRSVYLSFLLLLAVVYGSSCPSGYKQAPNGGDCFQSKEFYDSFATRYVPKTFDQADSECNMDGGGMLASIHSKEEMDFLQRLPCMLGYMDIGLRCKGRVCKWDDGSPLSYTNFRGEGPLDDGKTRCYGFDDSHPAGTWTEHDCGQHERDCWICRVKAQTIECLDGETEYKGGCISVHTTPLDQQSAEASCQQEGGHLASIHSLSYDENKIYMNAALRAGVNGTIYIGGQFPYGQFSWMDGSRDNANYWANGFPNTFFGYCVQMLLASEFGVQGQWTNVDCATKQPYMCFRDGSEYGPAVPIPKASPGCPPLQKLTDEGTIYSPNYPILIPSEQRCEYVLNTDTYAPNPRPSVRFPTYDCQAGTTLSLFDGLLNTNPFATFNSSPPSNQWFNATVGYMRIVFTTTNDTAPIGTGWAAEFTTISD